MKDSNKILNAAEEVVRILRKHQINAVVIGAVAMAAYHYVRNTEDIDLGVNADISTLREITHSLERAGFDVEFREPDGSDGVIDVKGSFGLLQIVSFENRFPAVIKDALALSVLSIREGSTLNVVPIPQLIALKLYAGGTKSKADIIELLIRNPDLDLELVRNTCEKYRLPGFEDLIREADSIR